MPAYPTTKLDREIDRQIAAQNKRITDAMCGGCIGRGFVYEPCGPEGDEYSKHVVKPCKRCLETGLRMTQKQLDTLNAFRRDWRPLERMEDGSILAYAPRAGVHHVVLPSGLHYRRGREAA